MPAHRIFRPAIADLIPYEPGKPVEEVQRELGLDRVVKLASNEGQFGPFPAALAALDPGDEVVFGWPSFASYPLATIKMGATPVRVPMTDHHYDGEPMLAA